MLSLILASMLQFNEVSIQTSRDSGGIKCLSVSVSSDYLSLKGGLIPAGNIFGTSPLFFAEASLGVKVRAGNFYGKAFQGVAVLSATAPGLPTYWQLPTTIGGGIQNSKASIGFVWQHFSNGTTNPLNTGREFMGVEVGFRF